MRNLIILIVTAGLLVAVNIVNPQNDAAFSGKQLAKVWERSGQTDDKPGIIEGNAVLVFDGDTIGIVTKSGSRYTIRLRGIDAPETRQPFGRESTDQLAYLVQGMNVVAIVDEKDLKDRQVGAVFIDGEDVSLAQIRKGMAWSSDKNSGSMSKEQRSAYVRAERSARNDHVGLWSSHDPIEPWVFRGENGSGLEELNNASNNSISKTESQLKGTTRAPSPADTKGSVINTNKKYVLGPRGGCYYLNDQGAKVYVRNKDLCNKQ